MRMQRMETILYKDLSYKICGICFKAHNDLGRFRSERSYCDYLEKIFKDEQIIFVREKSLEPSFEGEIARRNRPDFIINDEIILEIKVKSVITREDYFQVKRYLVSSNKRLGLIINFQQPYLYPKRVLNPEIPKQPIVNYLLHSHNL